MSSFKETALSIFGSATFWTGVAAVAASVSASLAAIYTWLTYRLVRSQNEPNIVVYVKHDDSRTTILQIVIENIGRGIARNVQFKTSRPVPSRAWGLPPDEIKPATTMVSGPLIDGIPPLGPGDSRKIAWGQFGGLTKALGNDVITVEYSYEFGKGQAKKDQAVIECRSFADTDAVDSEALRIIKQLKRIASALEKTSTLP